MLSLEALKTDVDSSSSSQLSNRSQPISVNNDTVVILTAGVQVKVTFTEPRQPLIKVVEHLWH
nr:hypothetical protein [Pseudomonas synxantha]